MARSAKTVALSLAALTLLGAGVVGGQFVSLAGAAAGGRAPTQPSIAIVDMEKVFNGINSAGSAFVDMMSGGNIGKAVVKVVDQDPYPVVQH